jgi:hypothetical protein
MTPRWKSMSGRSNVSRAKKKLQHALRPLQVPAWNAIFWLYACYGLQGDRNSVERIPKCKYVLTSGRRNLRALSTDERKKRSAPSASESRLSFYL